MTSSYGHYEYLGDDPAEVASAMTDLRGVGGRLGSLAGTVEHDTGLLFAVAQRAIGNKNPAFRRNRRAGRLVERAWPHSVLGAV